ncbi:DUF1697 domain-containing protein [uncultured Erythrobacter sp.]|uniref:DUF1697 domain-containing protein n=1 Tax=uncultured Erythrobacter sp. TaxID=263913 RepID=UPI002616CA9A|nr:DUF1697 domain-containing protein [uncultured Erythrobacter sp.]
MARLLALLGSINIGGNRVKMVDLKAAFAEEGFKELVTVAASGNLILSDERDPVYIEKQLERVLADRFKFNSCVMVRTKEQVQTAVDDNPFHGTGPEHGSDKMVHSIFLSQQPDQARFDALLEEHSTKGSERLALGDRVLYLDYVHGVGVSDLSSKFLERRLGCKGTARNMNSLKNIISKMA